MRLFFSFLVILVGIGLMAYARIKRNKQWENGEWMDNDGLGHFVLWFVGGMSIWFAILYLMSSVVTQ